MYKYSSWRVFFFFAGAILMQLFMIWLHAKSTPALEKKQNDVLGSDKYCKISKK